MKKIIIQGDDWGYTPEISDGLDHAYGHGVLTETTVMVNLLDPKKKSVYRDRINNLENKSGVKKPKLGVGVHLNLTFGKPMSPKWPQKEFTRPLKRSGDPKEWKGSTWREYFSQFSEVQVEEELRRQMEFALEIFEDLAHIDSHQMVTSYKPVDSVFEKLALEYKLPARPVSPLSEKPVYGGDFVVDSKATEKLKDKGIKFPDTNIFKLFFNEKDPLKSFLEEVDNAGEGVTEIMFHPAKGKNADDWRQTDLKTLTDKRVLDYFSNDGVELVTYKDL